MEVGVAEAAVCCCVQRVWIVGGAWMSVVVVEWVTGTLA